MIAVPSGMRLVLASASPRRAELLRSVGLNFDVMPADIDESVMPGEIPAEYVARLSIEKARVIAERLGSSWIVIAADTTVDVEGQILEKPVDDDDARRMLGLLSARTHLVHTGVTVMSWSGDVEAVVVETAVEFIELTADRIEWYIGTGEPVGKAGAYAIQGGGGAFVRNVHGSVTNVIGLPIPETLDALANFA